MESLRSKKGFICDMDGVIYHGNQLLPGVKEFVEWLQKEEKQEDIMENRSCIQQSLDKIEAELASEISVNELAKKAKTAQGLTPEEKEEQALLRREYLDAVRGNLEAQLNNTYIQRPDGSRIQMKKRKD